MDKENVTVITDREQLYDKCENMEQLYGKYYLPLLYIHYKKTYDLEQQLKKKAEVIKRAVEYINNLTYWYEHNDNICSLEDKFTSELLQILEDKEVE